MIIYNPQSCSRDVSCQGMFGKYAPKTRDWRHLKYGNLSFKYRLDYDIFHLNKDPNQLNQSQPKMFGRPQRPENETIFNSNQDSINQPNQSQPSPSSEWKGTDSVPSAALNGEGGKRMQLRQLRKWCVFLLQAVHDGVCRYFKYCRSWINYVSFLSNTFQQFFEKAGKDSANANDGISHFDLLR